MKTAWFVCLKINEHGGAVLAQFDSMPEGVMELIEKYGLTVVEAPVVTVSKSLPANPGVIRK